jgi:ubiquinone/menaquinone biosynthesis C-methylase UbiE
VHVSVSNQAQGPTAASVRQLYDSMAETYDNIDEEAFYANQYRVYRRHLSSHRACLKGRLLDLGCGTGLQTAAVAATAREVVGVDLSPDLLNKAANRCRGLANVELMLADATGLPFADSSFDAVISYGEVLSHVVEYDKPFAEVSRVLKHGGTFIFSVLNKWYFGLVYSPADAGRALVTAGGQWQMWKCEDDRGHPTEMRLRTFTKAEIDALVTRNGFVVYGRQGIHVAPTVFPMGLQRRSVWLDLVFRKLGRLDDLVAQYRPFANWGYTCIYSSRRS